MHKSRNTSTNALKNVKKPYSKKPVCQIYENLSHVATLYFVPRYALMGKNVSSPSVISVVLDIASSSSLASPWMLDML